MNRVCDYQEVLDAVKRIKEGKKSFLTNFYPDKERIYRWIDSGKLFIFNFNDTFFVIRENKNFFNLFYCTNSIDLLCQDLTEFNKKFHESHIVVDLIGKMDDVLLLREVFNKNNFYDYVTMCRMSKITNENDSNILNADIKNAQTEHIDIIKNLLYTYFDPIAEQLPSYDEILKWVKLGHISIYEHEGNIHGFVIYDLIGLTSYLRYWFVHPEHRDEKIGSKLLNKYFADSKKTKRQLFWVIQSNDNAIKRYKRYGFAPENLYDFVMTNKNVHYETDCN